MRQNNVLFIILLLICSFWLTNAIAGGPGFQKDVYTWGGGGGGDDDDDNHGGGGDDDHHGGGDDDHWGGGDDDDDHWGHGDDDDDGNEVPLDGGLSFLAIAGAGLGIKAARDSMAKKKNSNK